MGKRKEPTVRQLAFDAEAHVYEIDLRMTEREFNERGGELQGGFGGAFEQPKPVQRKTRAA